MILHRHQGAFKDLVEIVGQNYKIDKSIIEKDYWVTRALFRLSQFPRNELVIFRGGTSLTKCYTDLERFSEDIDLAINHSNELTKTQKKNLIKEAEKFISSDFKETEGGIKSGEYRDVEFQYPTLFQNTMLMEMNTNIKIETVSFLNPNPYEKRSAASLIYKYLMENDGEDTIADYKLQPFEINVLSIRRTLIDKLVCLVRMSYSNDLQELKSKTRHLYDLHKTYELEEVKSFYNNVDALKEIISIVRKDEKESRFSKQYPWTEKWTEAPLFKIINDEGIKEIESSYQNNFGKEFVYGELPSYRVVVNTMNKIRIALEKAGE